VLAPGLGSFFRSAMYQRRVLSSVWTAITPSCSRGSKQSWMASCLRLAFLAWGFNLGDDGPCHLQKG
jgi:hypothetical protein